MDIEKSLNLLYTAVEYYEMNHDTGKEESTERHKANVWKAYNNIREGVTREDLKDVKFFVDQSKALGMTIDEIKTIISTTNQKEYLWLVDFIYGGK